MARVLRKVKEFEFKNGWLGEYVFQDDRGRVYASRISDCAVNNTTTAEFHNKKSIHAIRRTLNSNMKCAGVSGTVAASLLGAYGHFPRPSGPRSPARQGHIKRPVLRLAEPSFLRPANQCC